MGVVNKTCGKRVAKLHWEALNSLDLRNGGVALYLRKFQQAELYLSGAL